MDLRDTTNYLLRVPNVGHWIKLADNYMQSFNKIRDHFVLPSDHAVLQPIIESFAADTSAFSSYIRALRDASTGGAYEELHDLYRTISVRAMQVTRRTRLRKAVLVLQPEIEKLCGREISYDEQSKVAKWLEQIWGSMRLNTMTKERNMLRLERLSSEERVIVLDNFWKEIDAGIAAGKVELDGHDLQDIATELLK